MPLPFALLVVLLMVTAPDTSLPLFLNNPISPAFTFSVGVIVISFISLLYNFISLSLSSLNAVLRSPTFKLLSFK